MNKRPRFAHGFGKSWGPCAKPAILHTVEGKVWVPCAKPPDLHTDCGKVGVRVQPPRYLHTDSGMDCEGWGLSACLSARGGAEDSPAEVSGDEERGLGRKRSLVWQLHIKIVFLRPN